MDAKSPPSNPYYEVYNLPIEWFPDQGIYTMAGNNCASLWTGSTLAELLASVYRAAGREKYGYLLQDQGRKSTEADWQFICQFPTFLDGLEGINGLVKGAGWGRFEVVQYDAAQSKAVVHVYNAWESLAQQAMGVSWGIHYFAGKLAGWFSRHFETNCWATQTTSIVEGAAYDEFIVAPSSRTVDQELQRIEQEEQERQEELTQLVERRTAELQATVAELQQAQYDLNIQEATIRSLSTPVVQLWEGLLMVPLIGTIDHNRAQQLMESVLETITNLAAEQVIIDITGVSMVDTQVAQALIRVAQAAKLLGAEVTLTGIQPSIAQTLVHLGVDLGDIQTQGSLQAGIAAAIKKDEQ
ncbi:MAG: STAS domain-containing protein [Chloroflexota bacterium]